MDKDTLHELGQDPAFPVPEDNYSKGITTREYFAAMALQGILASGSVSKHIIVTDAIKIADMMIEELNKEK